MISETTLDIHLIEALSAKDDKAVEDICDRLVIYSKSNCKAASHFSKLLLGTIFRLSFQPQTGVEEIVDTMVYTATKVIIIQFEG